MASSQGTSAKEEADVHTPEVVDEKAEATEGYKLNANLYESDGLKLAEDGKTVLIPQPSDDPEDPLNWSWRKKMTILFVMSTIAFLPEFGSAVSIPAIVPQTIEYGLPPATVQNNLVANLVCIAGGAIITVIMSNYFGRLPIIFVWHIIALASGIWNATPPSFSSYVASRAVNGVFSIVAGAGGLMWIKDVFFFHEHPRMINLWSGGIVVAPYLSPLMEAFITWRGDWRWGYLVYSIMNFVGLIMIVVFLDETWYSRTGGAPSKHVKQSKIKRLIGLEQWPYMRHYGSTFLSVVFYFLNFAWVIGVNATTAVWITSVYGFTGKGLGLFYLAGIIGSVIGEVAGHWMHDGVGNFFMKRHGGRIDPEVRLYLTYVSSLLMTLALIILGFALQNASHYMVVAVFYAIQVVGIMIATTAINAYLLDSYPEGSGEVGAWIVFGRVFGGFMATYINIPWVQQTGAATAFGIQAGITVAASFIVVFLQLFGKRLRNAQGPMVFSH